MKKGWALLISMLVIFGSFVALISVHGETATSSGWKNAKEIDLGISYTKTNVYTSYYSRVILHFVLINATGNDDPANFTLCTPSPNFPNDIRFSLNKSGGNWLPQFIESYPGNNGTKVYPKLRANVWVRVPYNATKLYLFYGNNNTSVYSVPEQVFDYYDDFNYNNMTELENYYTYQAAGGFYAAVSNSQLELYGGSSSSSGEYVYVQAKTALIADPTNTTINVIATQKKVEDGYTMWAGIVPTTSSWNYGNKPYMIIGSYISSDSTYSSFFAENQLNKINAFPLNYWYTEYMTINYTSASIYIHNLQDTANYKYTNNNISRNPSESNNYPLLGIFKYNSEIEQDYFDYIAVYVNQNNNVVIHSVTPYSPQTPLDDAGTDSTTDGGAGTPTGNSTDKLMNSLFSNRNIAGFAVPIWTLVAAAFVVIIALAARRH